MDIRFLEYIVNVFDHSVSTRRRRHLTGGILLSVSILFGGLAVTIMTARREDEIDARLYD
jgi:hypothetical protein